jgi:hypothetical protein
MCEGSTGLSQPHCLHMSLHTMSQLLVVDKTDGELTKVVIFWRRIWSLQPGRGDVAPKSALIIDLAQRQLAMQRALAALLLYNFTTNGLEPRVPLRLKNPNFTENVLCCCICQFRRAPHCLQGRFCDFHCHCSLLAQTTTLVCWTLVHPSVSCAGAYTSVSWCVPGDQVLTVLPKCPPCTVCE